jgi:hypothetical protein
LAIKRAGNAQQQALALHMASLHPNVRVGAKTAGFLNNKASNYHWEQMRSILKDASATGSAEGRSTDDKSLFVETILTAIAPDSGSIEQTPSLVDTSKAIGLSKSTTRRKLKVATAKRNSLLANLDSVKWSRRSKRRKGFSKITMEIRASVCDWVKNHPNVIHSPIANDTILIKLEGHEEKQRVGKLLLEIPVRELHCLMVAKAEVGGLAVARDDCNQIIISDSMLRKIIKKDMPQVKKATDRHKQMCGCEVCIQIASHHKSLTAWRYRLLRKLEADAKDFPDDSEEQQQARQYRQSFLNDLGQLKQEKPRHAIASIMCDAASMTKLCRNSEEPKWFVKVSWGNSIQTPRWHTTASAMR